MNDTYWDTVIAHLRVIRGIELAPGLTDREVDAIERRCAFRFPDDLRMFLQRVHPLGQPIPDDPDEIVVGEPFPDWRNAPDDYLQRRFEGILDGIFFDIEHGFWDPAWGSKPNDLVDAYNVTRQELAKAPILIPIFAHRFMPNEPLLAGNPIFSLVQTDIIYYGLDLAHYLSREFRIPRPSWSALAPRTIRVWTESLNWHEFWPKIS